MSDTVTTLTRKTFNANMENVLCNGTRYADLAPDTRNLLWAAYNLTGDQGTMPVDQWAAVFASDVMDSITAPDTQPDAFRGECREWLAKRVAANQAAAKAPETMPASPTEALTPAPSTTPPADDQDPKGIQEAREAFRTAVETASKAKCWLDVGKHAAKVVSLYVADKTDKGERRSSRARAVSWCQECMDDAFLGQKIPDVEACLRLNGVAMVFGRADAAKLGVGRLNAFEPCIARESDTVEKWAWKGSVTEEQRTAILAFWAENVAGTSGLNANQSKDRVRVLLGRKPAENKDGKDDSTQTAENGQQGEQTGQSGQEAGKSGQNAAGGEKPAGNGQSSKPADSGKTAVAPKQPGDLAEHFAACLKDRTDTAAVWQAFGKLLLPSKADMEGFIHGLLSQGPKQATVDTLRALLSAAGNAISNLARQTRDTSKPPQSAAA
jgi:hypothetical protein